jgi:hypothetical protein
MGSKSRHKRKHLQSKKGKRKQISTLIARQQPAVAQTYKPTAPPKVVAPSVKEPTPTVAQTYKPTAPPRVAAPSVKEPTPTVARYPQTSKELRRIGMLAGILLVTLVVLALVLR